MSAFEYAKTMSREEILEKIAALDIREAGLCGGKLADRLAQSLEECAELGMESGVAAALNNADTACVLLEVLKNDPEKVLEGIAIAALALGTENKALYVPEAETELAKSLTDLAEKYQVEVKAEFVNVRANAGKALIHIVTAADLSDAFSGSYVPGVYVSVNGGAVRKAANGTTVAALADMADAKALLLGYEIRKPDAANLPVEEAGIANGVVKVLTAHDCVVAETEKHLTASRAQSCGKCVFCREGLIQLQYMQKEITEGRGKAGYVELTKEIGEAMCVSTPCTMGQTSAKIALTAMDQFAGEYEAHIKKKRCPAAVCSSLVNIYISPKHCTGCGDCVAACPAGCIEGQPGYIYMLDDYDCTKCGACVKACGSGAIVLTTGRVPRVPYRPTKVGKFRG